jgi:hypothetical protein
MRVVATIKSCLIDIQLPVSEILDPASVKKQTGFSTTIGTKAASPKASNGQAFDAEKQRVLSLKWFKPLTKRDSNLTGRDLR